MGRLTHALAHATNVSPTFRLWRAVPQFSSRFTGVLILGGLMVVGEERCGVAVYQHYSGGNHRE
jgi:hypothetical protein